MERSSLSKRKMFSIFLLSTLCLILSSGCTFISIPVLQGTQPFDETVVSGKGKDKILLVDISGVISTKSKSGLLPFGSSISIVTRVREELEKAAKDDKIQGLVLKMNTPGGTVTASDILYQEIKTFKEEKKIPVVVCMMDVAASGGYYIALAADTILAHPTSITGSIGVIALKFNAEELLEKIGVEDESIKSGDKKDIWSPFRPSTPEERKIMEEIIDSLFQRFLEVMAEGRKELSMEQIKKLADGRVYSARQALDLKLIDRIGYLEDAVEIVKRKAGIREARVVVYHRPFSYRNNIYSKMFSPDLSTFNLINVDLGTLTDTMGLSFMYLWLP